MDGTKDTPLAPTAAWRFSSLLTICLTCVACAPSQPHVLQHNATATLGDRGARFVRSLRIRELCKPASCTMYYEPECFGYVPTCWTSWPEHCPTACSVECRVDAVMQDTQPVGISELGLGKQNPESTLGFGELPQVIGEPALPPSVMELGPFHYEPDIVESAAIHHQTDFE